MRHTEASLARERTALAWSRTALGALVIAGLVVRFVERGRVPVPAAIAAAFALAVAAGIWREGHRARSRARIDAASRASALLAASAGVGVLAVLATVAALLALLRA